MQMEKLVARLQHMLTRLLMLALVGFMVLTLTRLFTSQVLVQGLGMNNGFTRFVLKGEPLTVTHAQEAPEGGQQEPLTLTRLADNYNRGVRAVTAAVEEYATEKLVWRKTIVEGAAYYEQAVGWNLASYEEYNNVIDLGHGYLTNFSNWFDVTDNVRAVVDFKSYLDAQGLPMLFVQYPNKVSSMDQQIDGVVDMYNNNASRLLAGMQAAGLHTLDLRPLAESQFADYRALFYNTDHHWRAETGLWAAGQIAQALERDFGFAANPQQLDPGNFQFTLYQKWFLGTLGKKATLARAVPDDFVLIHPRFATNLHLEIPSIGLDSNGDFDIIYDKSQLGQEPDYYGQNPYGAYLHTVDDTHDFVRLHNLDNPQGPRVLLIGDSFSAVVAPFLSLSASRLDYVDLRQLNDSIRDVVIYQGYDMVVIAYSSLFQVEYITGMSMYDFR